MPVPFMRLFEQRFGTSKFSAFSNLSERDAYVDKFGLDAVSTTDARRARMRERGVSISTD